MSKLLPFSNWLNWAVSTIWEALIEFCSIVLVPLAWPILIGFCFWNTRHQIRDAIDRILELNRDGLRFAEAEQGETQHFSGGLENGISSAIADFDRINKEDPTLVPFIEKVQSELNQINPNNSIELLILAISRKNRELARQTLLYQIYLSQIEALDFLNKSGTASQEDLFAFFTKHKNQFNGTPYSTFSDWISYLLRFSMAEYKNENYTITDVGRIAVKLIETFTPAERYNRPV